MKKAAAFLCLALALAGGASAAGPDTQKRVPAGAIAVEMEAAAVARQAQALGVPFYCVKAVSDVADESLSIDFNAALRQDGHFDTISILGAVLRHPLAGVPELFRLRNRSVRAANSLGDFFADCRF